MNKLNTASLEAFLTRLRQLQRSRSKQLVITAEEANDLAVSITQILLEQNALLREIKDLQDTNGTIEVSIGGGSFKDK